MARTNRAVLISILTDIAKDKRLDSRRRLDAVKLAMILRNVKEREGVAIVAGLSQKMRALLGMTDTSELSETIEDKEVKPA